MKELKTGDKVVWTDPTGEIRVGYLMERTTVVAEAPALKGEIPGSFKDVEKISWVIAEEHTGTPFAVDEKYLERFVN